jgi:Family of unknown function (DUF6191)
MTQWGLDTLFNPAKRHMDEEKRRLQSTREQLGDSSGGKRIDLESGKVTIRRSSAKDAAPEDGSEPAVVDESATAASDTETEPETGAETGAETDGNTGAVAEDANSAPAAAEPAGTESDR